MRLSKMQRMFSVSSVFVSVCERERYPLLRPIWTWEKELLVQLLFSCSATIVAKQATPVF